MLSIHEQVVELEAGARRLTLVEPKTTVAQTQSNGILSNEWSHSTVLQHRVGTNDSVICHCLTRKTRDRQIRGFSEQYH